MGLRFRSCDCPGAVLVAGRRMHGAHLEMLDVSLDGYSSTAFLTEYGITSYVSDILEALSKSRSSPRNV